VALLLRPETQAANDPGDRGTATTADHQKLYLTSIRPVQIGQNAEQYYSSTIVIGDGKSKKTSSSEPVRQIRTA